MENNINIDYYKSLPKKRMGAGVLILNEKDEILIVKPKYKTDWSIPGGVVEDNESPIAACIRETKEEIGLDLSDLKLLCVDYTNENYEKGDSLQFIFSGGVLSAKEIKNIKIDNQEIGEFKFLTIDKVLPLLSKKLQIRVPKCLDCIKNSKTIYLENGK